MDDPFLGHRIAVKSDDVKLQPSWLDTKSMGLRHTFLPSCWQIGSFKQRVLIFGKPQIWPTRWSSKERWVKLTLFLSKISIYIIPSIHLFNAETLDRLWWLKTIIYYTAPFCGSVFLILPDMESFPSRRNWASYSALGWMHGPTSGSSYVVMVVALALALVRWWLWWWWEGSDGNGETPMWHFLHSMYCHIAYV